MVAAFKEPRGLEEKERMKRTKRERCKTSAEKRFLSLELGLTNKQRDCCSFSAARLSILTFYTHSLFFLPDPFLRISPVQFIRHSSAHPPCGSIQAMSVHVSAHPIPPHMVVALHLCFVLSVFCTTLVWLECTATGCLLSN